MGGTATSPARVGTWPREKFVEGHSLAAAEAPRGRAPPEPQRTERSCSRPSEKGVGGTGSSGTRIYTPPLSPCRVGRMPTLRMLSLRMTLAEPPKGAQLFSAHLVGKAWERPLVSSQSKLVAPLSSSVAAALLPLVFAAAFRRDAVYCQASEGESRHCQARDVLWTRIFVIWGAMQRGTCMRKPPPAMSLSGPALGREA